MSGAGHMMDMNNRMKQNRSMKSSKRRNFISKDRDLHIKQGKHKKLEFKKVSEKELEKIKFGLRKKVKSDRTKEMIVLISVILILTIAIYIITS